MSESGLSCFISHLGDCIPWHVVCRRPSDVLETWIPQEVTLCTRQVIVHREGSGVQLFWLGPTWREDTEICTSGARWVPVRLVSRAVLVISAHLPHARQSVMSYRETLQEITCCLERFKSAFPRHHVVLGADSNTSLSGFEDGGDATVPLTKA